MRPGKVLEDIIKANLKDVWYEVTEHGQLCEHKYSDFVKYTLLG
jgi:hypothetical protein